MKHSTKACEDLKLLPLLKTTALPDLMQSALASAETFGLLSKIIPMVPSGVHLKFQGRLVVSCSILTYRIRKLDNVIKCFDDSIDSRISE